MVDIVRELNNRLSGSIVGQEGTGENGSTLPVQVDSFFKDHSDNLVVKVYCLEREEHFVQAFNEDEWVLDCPKVGMVFDGEKTYYTRRTPDRQWKGGYTSNVIRMEILNKVEVRELGLHIKGQTDKAILNFVFNPKYIPLVEGIESMKHGKFFSFPISSKFAVSLSKESKYPVLFYKNWIVGWVDGEEIHLPKAAHHLFEEVSQYSVCRRV